MRAGQEHVRGRGHTFRTASTPFRWVQQEGEPAAPTRRQAPFPGSNFLAAKELLLDARFASRHDARAAVFEYIEVYYNRQRRHSTLGYLTPLEFEARAATPEAA